MHNLADLVRQKAQSMNVQLQKATYMPPEDAAWLRHKKIVENLPGDYSNLLKDRLQRDSLHVHLIDKKEYSFTEVELPEYTDFPTHLEIVEHQSKGVIRVTYFAYNKITNTRFYRDIVDFLFK